MTCGAKRKRLAVHCGTLKQKRVVLMILLIIDDYDDDDDEDEDEWQALMTFDGHASCIPLSLEILMTSLRRHSSVMVNDFV